MCFSKSFWKFFVYATGGILGVFGIVLLALSIVISRKEFAKAAEIDNLIIGYGIAFGIVMFLIGACGWYAALKESKLLMTIYLIFITVLTASFIVVWSVAQAVQKMRENDVNELCSDLDTTWAREFTKLFPDNLCGPAAMITVRPTECLPLPTICKKSKNLQGCTDDEKKKIYGENTPSNVHIGLARYLEKEEKCTGFCKEKCRGMYLYSDCNIMDFKDKSCDAALFDVIKKNSVTIGAISGVCALVGVFVIMALLCLCYNQEFGKAPEEKYEVGVNNSTTGGVNN